MKSYEQIAESIFEKREKYLAEQKKKRQRTTRAVCTACSLCLIVAVGITVSQNFGKTPAVEDTQSSPSESQQGVGEGVYIPPMEITLANDPNVEMDMIGFFIYQGRIYSHYTTEPGFNYVGEYVGTATGMIDEWTKEDGYVDFAGSVRGDFYSVKGFDESFMLCMKQDNGDTQFYINDCGLTLKTGAELFEDRLNLPGNITGAEYMTRHSWYYGEGSPVGLDEGELEDVKAFVDTLCESEFMYVADIPLKVENSSVYDEMEIYHMFIQTDNGPEVHLRILDGGYVIYSGLSAVCLKVDQPQFDAFVEMLEN